MRSLELEKIRKPHLFAHRGGNAAGDLKENSKRAFNSAVSLGYKFLETDVILTKDKQVICYHGAHNWYTSRKSGLELRKKMQKLTYKQINDRVETAEKVPLLEDILTSFPQVCFSVDVKTKEVVEPTVEVIRSLKSADRVIITSFSLFRTLKANKLLRGQEKQASLCMTRLSFKLLPLIDEVFIRVARHLGIRFFQISYSRITGRLLRLAHKNSIAVYAWTVNEKKDISRLLDLGTDGIMSDESKLLLETAKSREA